MTISWDARGDPPHRRSTLQLLWSRWRLSELGKARGPDLSCGLHHVAPRSDYAGTPANPAKDGS